MWVRYYLNNTMIAFIAFGSLIVGAVVAFVLFEDLTLLGKIIVFTVVTLMDAALIYYVLAQPRKISGLAINTSTSEIELAQHITFFGSVDKITLEENSPYNRNGKNYVLSIYAGDHKGTVGVLGLPEQQRETLKTALPQFKNATFEGTTLQEILTHLGKRTS